MTATLKALGDMCPIDLNDPRVTQDAKNEFVIKIANESGLEIAPEHEAIFSEATVRLGLEPKFTVAPSEKSPPVEREVPEIPLSVVVKTVVPDARLQQRSETVAVHTPDELDFQAIHNQMEEQQHQEATHVAEEFSNDEPIEAGPVYFTEAAPTVVRTSAVEMYTRQTGGPPTEQVMYEAELLVTAEPEPSGAATFPAVAEQHSDGLTEESIEELHSLSAENEGVHDTPHQQLEATTQSWAEELRKEPIEMYEDFTAALANFAHVAELPDRQIEVSEHSAVLIAEEAATKQVAQVVAERLTQLNTDERQQAASIIKNIVGAAHGLQLLETQGAEEEMVEQVRAQLLELASNLSVLLGLELDEQDIEYFVRAISQLELGKEYKVADAEALDLESAGTHEVKLDPRLFGSNFADEDFASKTLGMFTLLCAGLHAKAPSAA